MTTPRLIRENYQSDADFKRDVRDALNPLIIQRGTGATAARPAKPWTGQQFYDTTLSKPIWWSGAAWKDASGTTV